MQSPPKIVLHCTTGYSKELDALVDEWMRAGVRYVGVVGKDASRVEDIIDELCIGDGSAPYFMLTAFHSPPETLDDAIEFAEQLGEEQGGSVKVVVL